MKLYSFQIKSVKSIVDTGKCYSSMEDGITVFAGQNEVGKSAVLEGLDFFRNGPSERFLRLSKRYEANPVAICEFKIENVDKNGTDEETQKIIEEVDSISFYRGDENTGEASQIRPTSEILELLGGIASRVITQIDGEENLEQRRSDAIKRVVQHFTNRIPQFILFDTFSDLLPGEILIRDIPNNKAVQDFQNVFNVNFADVITKGTQQRAAEIDAVERRATTDLNTYWSQVLTTADGDKYQFKINLLPSSNPDESKVEFLIHRNDSRPLFLEQKSKGFQWFNAFNLRLKALGVQKNELDKYVVLIDEPGQGLHETAQEDVKKVIEELASKGMQILYSTHNACLIGVQDEEILRIRLVYQNKERETVVQNITQFSSSSDVHNKDALSPIITAMGISQVGTLIDRDKICVVLEGITDHYYFSALRQILKKEDKYFFIPACGAQNVKPLVSIVISWAGSFRAVFDDGKEGRSVYNALKNQLYKNNEDLLEKQVRKLDGFEGIEDLFSKDDFDKYVVGDDKRDKTKANSEIAKEKKKELLGRLFLEKAKHEDISLSQETIKNFTAVFDWLDQ